mgnify:CR=1 FL=1
MKAGCVAAPRVGCAGWSLTRDLASAFAGPGTHLQRYATRLNCAEINSSFYRPHRYQTYVRWAESVAEDFRFSVKVPKLISHVQGLKDCEAVFDEFLAQAGGLGDRLGCLLVQLPPKLVYDEVVVGAFLSMLRQRYAGDVVVEPRHGSWAAADWLLQEHRVARAAVDPSRFAGDSAPAGWAGVRYWRLHGAPRIYRDAYAPEQLQTLAGHLQAGVEAEVRTWCIFDNTASGAALGNALTLNACIEPQAQV